MNSLLKKLILYVAPYPGAEYHKVIAEARRIARRWDVVVDFKFNGAAVQVSADGTVHAPERYR